MELKEGYKQTEIGIIPSDWEVKTVNELIDLLTDFDANGSFSSVAENVNVFDYQHFAWYVRSTDLENNTNITNVRYVDEPSYNFLKKTALYGGELLFLKRGDIGRIYLFEAKTKYATVAPNLYLLKLNKTINSKFLFYFFNTNIGQLQLKSKNASSTLGALYKDDVKSILVATPTLKEQTAIATALSDTDAWINSLEQLLAKKRQIKQGAMQELLQSKEGWEVKKLGDLITYKNGKSFESEIVENGNYLLITLNSINIKGKLKSEHLKINTFDNSLEKGDLIMVLSDVAHGNFLGLTDIIPKDNKYVLNQRMGALKNLKGVTSEYLSYYINKNQKYFKMAGKGSSQQNLGKDDILNFQINLPKTKEEQTRIATILSDMDEEIAQLENKLEKAKQIKQGMMQELLTGRIRLF
ncbi:restriction endonuclease subunit S [Flavobacterium sp. NRK F7]|uniref:restriction endonuclease subunit S n=1 Tax=Flavobacterium sp. NRK F7 TaxID=2954930 RepID=UPI0020915C15|nr:restriction endonuclease subunit S [Flavobacterium sp. NRK F7]MCO6163686.1 restriction endonuclease subunit S [Flavobacterium sp. NRK F7]